ncbi:MAG: aminoglycoside phosphotransferase family protein [Nanoarchaeota archaeon]
MVVKSLYGNTLDRGTIALLERYANEQIQELKIYIGDYNRKLQIIDAFGKEWDAGESKRLRAEIERIMRIDVSEDAIVKREDVSVRHIVSEFIRIVNGEISSKKKGIEGRITRDLKSLYGKLKVLEKNLSLQEKWFMKNRTEWEQNKNKQQLISMVKREGILLFDLKSTEIHDLIFETSELMKVYRLGIIQQDTYQECADELNRELMEFDRDRLDLSIEKTVKLGGGFKNPVVMVKTSAGCEYVAKAFTEQGAYRESMMARRFIKAAGGLVPNVVRLSDNEIICEKVAGTPIRKILTSHSGETNLAFFTLGKALADIHKNTLNKMGSYDPRIVFRKGYTKDYVKLKSHIQSLLEIGVISDGIYKAFLAARKAYRPTNLAAIIHGDAHLDNFFFVANPETIIIVDYDDAYVGDPLADVGRVVASMRNWQYKANLDEPFVEEAIDYFFRGYKSVLNIELRGTNLYIIRLYLIIIKSSKKLLEKIKDLIKNDTRFANTYGKDIIQFFKSNFHTATTYFHPVEMEKLSEIKFCLEQINNFIRGKKVALNRQIVAKAA